MPGHGGPIGGAWDGAKQNRVDLLLRERDRRRGKPQEGARTGALAGDDQFYEWPVPDVDPAGGGATVVAKTADYTFLLADAGNLFTFSGAYLGAFLPSSVPAEPWQVTLKNINLAPMYLMTGGNAINGVAATSSFPLVNSIPLCQNESLDVWSDGTAYWSRLITDKRPKVAVGSPVWYYTGFNSQAGLPYNLTAWAAEDGLAFHTIQNPAFVNANPSTFSRDQQPVINPVDGSMWVIFDQSGVSGNPYRLAVGVLASFDGGKTFQRQPDIDLTAFVTSVFGAPGSSTYFQASTQVWDGTNWWYKFGINGGGGGLVAVKMVFTAGGMSLDLTPADAITSNVLLSLHFRDPSTAIWWDYAAFESGGGNSQRYYTAAGAGPFSTSTNDTTHPVASQTTDPTTHLPWSMAITGNSNSPGWDGSFVYYVGNGKWRAYMETIGTAGTNQYWNPAVYETTDLNSTPWTYVGLCTLDGEPFFCNSEGFRPYGLLGSHYYDAQMAVNLANLVNTSSTNDAVLMAAVFGG